VEFILNVSLRMENQEFKSEMKTISLMKVASKINEPCPIMINFEIRLGNAILLSDNCL